MNYLGAALVNQELSEFHEQLFEARRDRDRAAFVALMADWDEALAENERGCPLNVCDVCGARHTMAGDCATPTCPRFDPDWLENVRAVERDLERRIAAFRERAGEAAGPTAEQRRVHNIERADALVKHGGPE